MKIQIKNRIRNKKLSGYIKTIDLSRYVHIFLNYQNHPEVIEKIQKLLLKHYVLVGENRSKFSKHLNKNVKVNVWNVKKAKYELVKIKDLRKQNGRN